MGRYMRKNKVATEVSQSLGVRTRARTLAMAQQQAKIQQQQQQLKLNFCYLELRSRKLEKLFELASPSTKRAKHSAKPPKTQQRRVRSSDPIGVVSVGAAPLSRSNSFTSSKQQQQQQPQLSPVPSSLRNEEMEPLHCVVDDSRASAQLEASCGDNAFDHDGHSSRDSFGSGYQRRLRESTPVCTDQEHHLRMAEAPGSSSKVRVTSIRAAAAAAAAASTHPEESFDVLTPEDIEEFFASSEQEPELEKTRLSDRYNYDFHNDCPLPGRFEWTSTAST